jgi:TRAP-type mannitol/chloroaromatic compound transport system permease small subunit
MQALLRVSTMIDALNERLAKLMSWAVLLAVLICSANAILRKLFSSSEFFLHNSSVMFELQFFFFSCMFLFGAAYTLRRDEHVRIDVISTRFSERTQVKVDILGIIFFMMPICILLLYYGFAFFSRSLASAEHSGDSGLLLWPFKILMPLGYFLLILQGISELIKRIGYLKGLVLFSDFRKGGHNPEEEVQEYIKATQAPQVGNKSSTFKL